MNRQGKAAAALVFLLFVACLFMNCRAQTDRETITALIARMEIQVEKRDVNGLIGLLAENYRDFEERDRAQTAAMVKEYFSRYRGIVVKVLASRIEIRSTQNAEVETEVAFYSGAASAFKKLIGFSGASYRFRFALQKAGVWMIRTAQWEEIPLSGLFPESLQILREMFPDL